MEMPRKAMIMFLVSSMMNVVVWGQAEQTFCPESKIVHIDALDGCPIQDALKVKECTRILLDQGTKTAVENKFQKQYDEELIDMGLDTLYLVFCVVIYGPVCCRKGKTEHAAAEQELPGPGPKKCSKKCWSWSIFFL